MDLAANSVTFANVASGGSTAVRISRCGSKQMQGNDLEPTTIRTRYANVRNVIRAAVDATGRLRATSPTG